MGGPGLDWERQGVGMATPTSGGSGGQTSAVFQYPKQSPPRTARQLLALGGSPRLMQGSDISSSTTASSARVEAVIIRARVVWM
ncbi:unnamed protein product [Arctogadus glacialis]